jgi:hypothetical protein
MQLKLVVEGFLGRSTDARNSPLGMWLDRILVIFSACDTAALALG